MKFLRTTVLVALALAMLVSCESLASNALSGAISGVVGSPSGAISSAAASASVEFQGGEILASADTRSMFDSSFYVAKVLTPASPATKNQAEVVFVSDGKKQWVNFVLNSRKATKADFTVGAPVLFLAGWQEHDEIGADSYRKDRWGLGNVTSVDELFKNRVEIDGDSYAINFLRVPLDPVK